MRLERVTDTARIISLIRHPAIEPAMLMGADIAPELLAAFASSPQVVALLTDEGGFIAFPAGRQVYEIHAMLLPKSPPAEPLLQQALRYIFQQTDALAISTWVADDNRAARRLAERAGFVPLRDAAPLGTPGTEYLLTLKEWVKGL
jgi:hypothetical protein